MADDIPINPNTHSNHEIWRKKQKLQKTLVVSAGERLPAPPPFQRWVHHHHPRSFPEGQKFRDLTETVLRS